MALGIVRVNCTHRPPGLPGHKPHVYTTRQYKGCARLGMNYAIKKLHLAKDPLVRIALQENTGSLACRANLLTRGRFSVYKERFRI